MEDIKPVVLEKHEFDYREEIKRLSLEVSNIQDSDAKKKNNRF